MDRFLISSPDFSLSSEDSTGLLHRNHWLPQLPQKNLMGIRPLPSINEPTSKCWFLPFNVIRDRLSSRSLSPSFQSTYFLIPDWLEKDAGLLMKSPFLLWLIYFLEDHHFTTKDSNFFPLPVPDIPRLICRWLPFILHQLSLLTTT